MKKNLQGFEASHKFTLLDLGRNGFFNILLSQNIIIYYVAGTVIVMCQLNIFQKKYLETDQKLSCLTRRCCLLLVKAIVKMWKA